MVNWSLSAHEWRDGVTVVRGGACFLSQNELESRMSINYTDSMAEFSDYEKGVIQYFCDESASSPKYILANAAVPVLIGVTFFVFGIVNEDLLWSVVGFGILLICSIRTMVQSLRYHGIYRDIFRKIDSSIPMMLSSEEELVLFEWSYRFCETSRLEFDHRSEAVVIDKIAGGLENTLIEPFQANYTEALKSARENVLAAYKAEMGRHFTHTVVASLDPQQIAGEGEVDEQSADVDNGGDRG